MPPVGDREFGEWEKHCRILVVIRAILTLLITEGGNMIYF